MPKKKVGLMLPLQVFSYKFRPLCHACLRQEFQKTRDFMSVDHTFQGWIQYLGLTFVCVFGFRVSMRAKC